MSAGALAPASAGGPPGGGAPAPGGGARAPARAARPGPRLRRRGARPTVQPGEETSVGAVLLSGPHPGQQDAVDNAGRGRQRRRTPTRRIRAPVEAAGGEPVFLPAHSPDLSPIEEAFS